MGGARLVILAALVVGCGHMAPTGGLPAASLEPTAGAPGGEPPPSAAPNPGRIVPPGLPIPDAAQPVEPGPGAIAAWTIDDPLPVVFDRFLSVLPAAGFPIDDALPGGEAAVIRFAAPDGTGYQLNLTGRQPVRAELGPVRP